MKIGRMWIKKDKNGTGDIIDIDSELYEILQ